jgi:hypothetical protein
MSDILAGATALASAAVALWFFRFWRDSRDRLFGAFALAFALFAVNRLVLAQSDRDSEELLAVYGFRLAAFVAIIGAIVDRNRR